MITNICLFLENIVYRSDINIGDIVLIVQKQDQRTNKTTKGRVKNILTGKSRHTRGIKVRLENGKIGRVVKLL